MKITQAQRNAYRYVLEDKGVPEVIAFMAARNYDWEYRPPKTASIVGLIYLGFFWGKSPEGHDFWEAVVLEAQETCK